MIVFENRGEIDPRLAMLIGVNVKESSGAIGIFGTGLKYAVACSVRWGESIVIQSGESEFGFTSEDVEIRGRTHGIIHMCGRHDRAQLGFTTEFGKQWEPWMVYRELWCNARDEPESRVYVSDTRPAPRAGLTRVLADGPRLRAAHEERSEFILEGRTPLHVTPGLEIYEGEGRRIFYRGIAVQTPTKSGMFTYNITSQLWLTEDRTAGSWATDPIIARGLASLEDQDLIARTLVAPQERMESRLDYCSVSAPGEIWSRVAGALTASRPMDVPTSVRNKFVEKSTKKICPTCMRPVSDDDQIPF